MTDMEILQLADKCGVVAVTQHQWDGKRFNHTDDYLDGDAAALVIFAKAVAQHEREACAIVCDDINAKYKWPDDVAERVASQWCADSIRARGQA